MYTGTGYVSRRESLKEIVSLCVGCRNNGVIIPCRFEKIEDILCVLVHGPDGECGRQLGNNNYGLRPRWGEHQADLEMRA